MGSRLHEDFKAMGQFAVTAGPCQIDSQPVLSVIDPSVRSLWQPSLSEGEMYYYPLTRYRLEHRCQTCSVCTTPGANTGKVDVPISSDGDGGSTVHVAYQLTGLTPTGNADLQESFSESEYAAMMEQWRTMINNRAD